MRAKFSTMTTVLAIGAMLSLSPAIISMGIENNEITDTSEHSILSNDSDLCLEDKTAITEVDSELVMKSSGIIRISESKSNFNQLELHSDTPPVYSMEEANNIIENGTVEYYSNSGSSLINTESYISDVYAVESLGRSTGNDLWESKSYIYHMMLNSVDYFNSARGSMVYAMNLDAPIHIEFQTNIVEQCSYECLSQNGQELVINYVGDGMGFAVNPTNSTYESYVQSEPVEYTISDNDRFVLLDNGESLAINRNDLTNLSIAGNSCLFPQSYAMSRLVNFSSWNISGTENVLDRACVVIDGAFEDDSFRMYVDLNTGILMKYEDFDINGDLTGYLQVDSIDVDKDFEINTFNPKEYTKVE